MKYCHPKNKVSADENYEHTQNWWTWQEKISVAGDQAFGIFSKHSTITATLDSYPHKVNYNIVFHVYLSFPQRSPHLCSKHMHRVRPW